MRQIDRRRLSRRWHREEKNWLEDYLEILASPPRTRRPPVVRLFIKLGLSRLKPMPGPSYRVHYNLACLYSRSASCRTPDDPRSKRHLAKAREQLDKCLEEATGAQERAICSWAKKDPGLKALQEKISIEGSGTSA